MFTVTLLADGPLTQQLDQRLVIFGYLTGLFDGQKFTRRRTFASTAAVDGRKDFRVERVYAVGRVNTIKTMAVQSFQGLQNT